MSATHDESNRRFVADLIARCDGDRGQAAALRRYWSDTTRHHAYPVLGRLSAIGHEAKFTVAALYAVHPLNGAGFSVGRAALQLGERKDGSHPYDRHFRRLLASDDLAEDLALQLHRLAKRLSRGTVPLDYARLLKDLSLWQSGYAEGVKISWARDFWQAPTDPVTA